MTIEFNAADQTITLNTAATSYQIKISPEGVLLHTWYGEKTADDMSYQINYRDRGFAGQIDDFGNDRTKSLDVLPQEYPGTATGER